MLKTLESIQENIFPVTIQRMQIFSNNESRDEPRGELEKKWIKIDGEEKLVKFNNKHRLDSDLMEMLMYQFLSLIDVRTMPVSLGFMDKDGITINCSILGDIVKKSEGNEMIFLEDKFYECAEKNGTLSYLMPMEDAIKNVFEAIETLPNITEEMAKDIQNDFIVMLFTSYIFDNPDRHFFNYALIYNQYNRSYRFSDLFDHETSFDGFNDKYFKCTVGIRQYEWSLFSKVLIDNYYEVLEPLIEKMNIELTFENILQILNNPCYADIDKLKKEYIYTTILTNLSHINTLVNSKKTVYSK